MTEDQPAIVSRETAERLEMLAALIIDETTRQNLISANTLADFQNRHIADSLQLATFMPPGTVVDIGSGGGFPGLVLACVRMDPIHLVEPRRLRAEFLVRCAAELGLSDRVAVHQAKIERIQLHEPAAAITARAVASLAQLFSMASHLSDVQTRWVLPKGRTVRAELEDAQRLWHGNFRLEPSSTDVEAAIVLATDVRRRVAR